MRYTPTTHKQKGSRQNVGTPWWIIDIWESEFAPFVVDLAADKDNAKCANYVTEDEDSLSMDWHKRCNKDSPGWLNNPYANCAAWVSYCHAQAHLGATVVQLIPASLHRVYARTFMQEGPCAVIPFGPAIKFDGYDCASSILHMFVVWNKGLSGEIYWMDLKNEDNYRKIFGEIKSKLV